MMNKGEEAREWSGNNGIFAPSVPGFVVAGGIRLNADGTMTDLYALDEARSAFCEEIIAALPGVTAQEVIAAVREKRAAGEGSPLS